MAIRNLIQSNSGNVTAVSPTFAFTNNVSGGSALVACFRITDATITVSSVTDTLGNTWTVNVGPVDISPGGNQRRSWIATAPSPKGGPNTITINFTNNANCQCALLEYSGIEPSNIVDVSGSAADNTATPIVVNYTTTVPTIAVVWFVRFNANPFVNTGYTLEVTTSSTNTVWDQIFDKPGAKSATCDCNPVDGGLAALVVTLKLARILMAQGMDAHFWS